MRDDPVTGIREVLGRFDIAGECLEIQPFGTGHINATYASRWRRGLESVRYIHQRINDAVFKRPDQVMENIYRVTSHLYSAWKTEGVPDPERRTLTVIPARDGKPWVNDEKTGWWRTYAFVEGSCSMENAESSGQARLLGAAVGKFQKQLASLPPPRLHEAITHFHDMEWRYQRFHEALKADPKDRVREVSVELGFMLENEERGSILSTSLRTGSLPERICHNDTKMNNMLFDLTKETVLCVADLDTVMPGTVLYDFGDLVRTVTTRAREDERDLSTVIFNLDYFEALLEGYLSEAGEFLDERELDLLAEAGRSMTQIMAIRFLTDFIEGDHYYHVAYPGHNLDRARNQIALIGSMDRKWGDIQRSTDRLRRKYNAHE